MKAEKGVRGGLEMPEGPLELGHFGSDDELGSLAATEPWMRDSIQGLAKVGRALSDGEREHFEEMRHLLLEIIKVDDAFERVFRAVHDMGDRVDRSTRRWIRNFRSISRILHGVLRERGVVEIETVDQSFDPRWHRVSELVQDSERPDGTIVGQVRKGYAWRKVILRKAELVVVRNDEGEDAASRYATGRAS